MQQWDVEPATGTHAPNSAAFEPLARQLLEPCPRHDAERATVIRKRLKQDLGRWRAEAILSFFAEACLRHQGKCSRYFVDANGATLRMRMLANEDAQ
jgi:hypothetical protein